MSDNRCKYRLNSDREYELYHNWKLVDVCKVVCVGIGHVVECVDCKKRDMFVTD